MPIESEGARYLTDSKTEANSTSHPPAPEGTNRNRSLNLQKERDAKESNSVPVRTGRTQRDAPQSLKTEFALFLLLYQQIHTKLC